MEPPYAERHVRWCERSHGELIPMLLLDLIFKNRKKHEKQMVGMGLCGLDGMCPACSAKSSKGRLRLFILSHERPWRMDGIRLESGRLALRRPVRR